MPTSGSKTLPIKLPVGLYLPCIVPWDHDSFMVIGGASNNGSPRSETYFVFLNNETLTNGPELLDIRYGHACGEMVLNGESYIMVIGGYGQYHALQKSTEILSKSNLGNGWKKGNI